MSDQSDTLYLIDGHAQIFRAYYAIRSGMTSPITGESTHATFAYTGMLLKLFEQFLPRYVALTIDSPGPTFREEIYPDYKANREAPPEDFAPQVERILEITRLFGIPVLGREGAEADDIMATLTERLLHDPRAEGVHIRLVSKDKDLEQLLGDRVTMFDIHTDTTLDADTLRRDKGITPEQVADVLALTGDKVDNIPGVAGIGPKTAARLIQEFGSLQAILNNLDRIKGKRRENLQQAAEFLPRAHTLVTLSREVNIPFELEDARAGGIDAAGLQRVFRELGFQRHQQELARLLEEARSPEARRPEGADPAGVSPSSGAGESAPPAGLFDAGARGGAEAGEEGGREAPATAATCDYQPVLTEAELDRLIQTLDAEPLVAVDTETIGLGHRKTICGLSFSWAQRQGVYVPLISSEPERHLDPETVLARVRPWMEDPARRKCGHNLKYDLLVLRHAGIRLRGIEFDSMLGAYLLEAPGLGLDNLALSELGHETIPISRLIGSPQRGKEQSTLDQVAIERVTPYAAEDADLALRLTHRLRPRLEEAGMSRLADEVETPLIPVLADMEHRGIRVDPQVLDAQKASLQHRMQALREEIHQAAGTVFNLDSPKQLGEVLFTRLELPVIKRTKTGPSTDMEVLEKLCEREDLPESIGRVPRLVLEYRQLAKLVGTYLEALGQAIRPDTGRVHARFHQAGTATGRLSSSGPNLQNIPIRTDLGRRIRRAFIAEPGHRLIRADYSQIELRLLAHLSEDEDLTAAFRAGQDVHAAVAARVFGVDPTDVSDHQRAQAKIINFGIVYGVTPFGLARRIEGIDVPQAKALIDDYRTRFPGIDRFLAQCVEHAQQHGYVRTILGRRRSIGQISARNAQARALGQRLAINTVVQGSAADLNKVAMVNLHRRIEREDLPVNILLQIHDELVLETPESEVERVIPAVRREMEKAMTLTVPLDAEIATGRDWFDAK